MTQHATQTLLVIGAGPKAIALAAKRYALAKLGMPVPNLKIIDAQGVASHWSGQYGFTDGRQMLGTRPEKDIGFPYASTCWGDHATSASVVNEMFLLSWQSYLVHQEEYSEWIDRGRTRPTHREWSVYLRWVAESVGMEVIPAQVHRIGLDGERHCWQLECQSTTDGGSLLQEGDGLVLTGPGTPIVLPGQPRSHPRILDGDSFWRRVDELGRLCKTTPTPLRIGVIGTGETAAAIVVSLLNTVKDTAQIEVISPYGVLYSRDEGFDENRLFSDPDGSIACQHGNARNTLVWSSLTERDRREFVRRTDRGVFSLPAMQEINRAENVRTVMGTAKQLHVSEQQVIVDSEYNGDLEHDTYDYVVVAIGFNALWFTELFDDTARVGIEQAIGKIDKNAIEHAIDVHLELEHLVPLLHLPMLAGVAQGPGFPNLSSLGLLSDRILSAYIR